MPVPRLPIGFAHRGARAHAAENTLAAFDLALRFGADGLETDAWLTRDGDVVLDHDGAVVVHGRRRPLRELRRAELPARLPSLRDLYTACGSGFELSIDVKDAVHPDGRAVAAAVIEVAAACGEPERLWLCGRRLTVARWREFDARVRLVADVREADLLGGGGLPAYALRLADLGVAAVNLRGTRWSPWRVDAVHAAGLLAFGWRANSSRRLRRLLRWGCDGVYSDDVPRMKSAVGQAARERAGC